MIDVYNSTVIYIIYKLDVCELFIIWYYNLVNYDLYNSLQFNFKCANNYIIYNLKYVSHMVLIRQ